MEYTPFDKQAEVLLDTHRIKCMFAAKRSGKSECAYVEDVMKAEQRLNWTYDGKDPYRVAIVAPTHGMMQTLVWPKFRIFAKPFEVHFHQTHQRLTWATPGEQPCEVIGASAEKIKRIEGFKLNHVHLTEVFQMSKGVVLEMMARTSDSKGTITMEGSLGPDLPNPRKHWLYKMFVENHFPDSRVWTWFTRHNPYFPQDELARLKNGLDPRTFRQMFEIDWDTPPTNMVYDDLDEGNFLDDYRYNPDLPTFVSIDWGFTHPMAVLFFQYDKPNDTVYCFDEIVESKLKREKLYEKIKLKSYRISKWFCDPAGKKEDEAMSASNINWFKAPPRNIDIKYKRTQVAPGIVLVRTFILDGMGRRRLKFSRRGVPKTIDCLLHYQYPEKDGVILNENPLKKDDDPADSLRYYFVNNHSESSGVSEFATANRWGKQWQFSTKP